MSNDQSNNNSIYPLSLLIDNLIEAIDIEIFKDSAFENYAPEDYSKRLGFISFHLFQASQLWEEIRGKYGSMNDAVSFVNAENRTLSWVLRSMIIETLNKTEGMDINELKNRLSESDRILENDFLSFPWLSKTRFEVNFQGRMDDMMNHGELELREGFVSLAEDFKNSL